jgi:hypothetical protein
MQITIITVSLLVDGVYATIGFAVVLFMNWWVIYMLSIPWRCIEVGI